MPQAKAIPSGLANCPSRRACPGRLDRLEEPEPSHKPQQFTRDERLVRGVPMHTLLSARRARDDRHVPPKRFEHTPVVPTSSRFETAFREPEQPAELVVTQWRDLERLRHAGSGEGPAVETDPSPGPLRPT